MPAKIFILAFVLVTFILSCGKNGSSDPITPPTVPDTPTVPVTTFKNPLLTSGPDPWVAQKDGFYYYTHTLGNKIAIWKTAKMDELYKASPVTVWNAQPNTTYSADIWAPELHFLNNKWYLYFAADNNGNNSTHRIYVLENTSSDPTAGVWVMKGKLSDITDKWAIDASVFTYNGTSYEIWSGWQGDVDGEQDIFIAKLANPYTIGSQRVLIARPSNEWETKITSGINVMVNEGPEALINNSGKLFITYSAGGCWSDDYSLGLLSLKEGGDPMNASDWIKNPSPVFTKNTNGAYGPGHNGFFKSPDGTEDWILYHANNTSGQGCGDARSPRMQKFVWKADGTPDFGSPVSTGIAITKPSGE